MAPLHLAGRGLIQRPIHVCMMFADNILLNTNFIRSGGLFADVWDAIDRRGQQRSMRSIYRIKTAQ